MKLFGKYIVVDVKNRTFEAYTVAKVPDKNEAAYATYRAITGATVQESYKAVRPWLKEWEGKK